MSNSLQDVRIVRVSTISFFVFTQLRAQLEELIASGADLSVVSSDDQLCESFQIMKGCTFRPLNITRQISFFADMVTLIKLVKMFRKNKFHIVHSTTPKAGLLCAIAGRLSGVPVCVHTFTGQPWVTMSGLKKWILKLSDKLIVGLNTCCYVDSFSQRAFLIKNKIASPCKLKVIGNGSLAGVNTDRFNQNNFSDDDNKQLKLSLGIGDSTRVLLFVGRITKEKGIFELINAVHDLLKTRHDVVLIVTGPFEKNNEEEIRAYAQELCNDKVIFTGFHEKPECFMAISDLLCLPSYREGFGTVVIEAAAMGVPTIGTNIYGLTDAIVDGITGLLIEPKNTSQLYDALKYLLSDVQLRLQMGNNAKNRAISDFDSKFCNDLLIQEYKRWLDNIKINHSLK